MEQRREKQSPGSPRPNPGEQRNPGERPFGERPFGQGGKRAQEKRRHDGHPEQPPPSRPDITPGEESGEEEE